MARIFLGRVQFDPSQFTVAPMNFDQPWRYPDYAYEPYVCIISVKEAIELLADQLDDIMIAMADEFPSQATAERPAPSSESMPPASCPPNWRVLSSHELTKILASEAGHDLLLALERKHRSVKALAQLRTIDSCIAQSRRIVIRGRAVRYGFQFVNPAQNTDRRGE